MWQFCQFSAVGNSGFVIRSAFDVTHSTFLINPGNFMTWRTIGRPHYFGRNRDRRRRAYDARYGKDGWRIRHRLGGEVLDRPDAARHCADAYAAFLAARPELLDWLCTAAADIYQTAHSNIRSGLDYALQETKMEHVHDIAVRNALAQLGRRFSGEKLVHIGGQGQLDAPLNPGAVPFHHPEWIVQPALELWWQPDSVEAFWQSNKVLQIRVE